MIADLYFNFFKKSLLLERKLFIPVAFLLSFLQTIKSQKM